MALLKTSTLIVALCLYIKQSSCDVDPNLTVENANSYIAKNKDTVNQTYRLKYHVMAPIGWINDPNGFIFYQGEYHLFYQYNPYNTSPNKIHWGHVKSKDLIHWEDLPVALAPDQAYDGDGVFSGSTIVKDGKLYVMYTGNSGDRQVQCIAVSEDGITFQKIEQNPVLNASNLPSNAKPEDFRDPKVFKRGDIYYVVTVSKTVNETGQVLLYHSTDLINWEFKSILLEGTKDQGVMWECPDLFEIDGKDVLLVSVMQLPRSGNDYHNVDSVVEFIGEVDWDKGAFKLEATKEMDHGMDFYASQTITDDKGRRIMTAWMNMWSRTYPTAELNQGWVGGMILPREIELKDGFLVQKPIAEIYQVLQQVAQVKNVSISDKTTSFDLISGEVGVLELEVNLKDSKVFSIQLRVNSNESTVLLYNSENEELTLDRTNSGVTITGNEDPQVFSRKVAAPLLENRLKLQVFLDQSSVEVFINNGSETLTATIYPTQAPSDGIYFAADGTAVIENLTFSKIDL